MSSINTIIRNELILKCKFLGNAILQTVLDKNIRKKVVEKLMKYTLMEYMFDF